MSAELSIGAGGDDVAKGQAAIRIIGKVVFSTDPSALTALEHLRPSAVLSRSLTLSRLSRFRHADVFGRMLRVDEGTLKATRGAFAITNLAGCLRE